jgi:hypothetical protein
MIKKQTDPLGNESFFDKTNQRFYSRIIGGLATPGEKNGFAVIVGEERLPDWLLNKPKLYLLKEFEEQDTGALLRHCSEYSGLLNVQRFVSYISEQDQEFFRQWNRREKEERRTGLRITPAPMTESQNITFHINILRENLREDHKVLQLLPESRVKNHILDIPHRDLKTATADKYPAIAALGYAVAYLTAYPYKPRTKKKREYHIFDRINRRTRRF